MKAYPHPLALKKVVGEKLGVSDWWDLTQDMVDKFADLTDDHNWIHVDTARATAEIGGTIAHGYLTLSLVPAMSRQVYRVDGTTRTLNYGCNRVRFPHTVPVGSRLRAHLWVKSVAEFQERVVLTLSVEIEVEGADRPGCVVEYVRYLEYAS